MSEIINVFFYNWAYQFFPHELNEISFTLIPKYVTMIVSDDDNYVVSVGEIIDLSLKAGQ